MLLLRLFVFDPLEGPCKGDLVEQPTCGWFGVGNILVSSAQEVLYLCAHLMTDAYPG